MIELTLELSTLFAKMDLGRISSLMLNYLPIAKQIPSGKKESPGESGVIFSLCISLEKLVGL